MSDRYSPKLRPLSVLKRDPIFSQEIEWSFGPNFGDSSHIRVTCTDKNVTIKPRSGEEMMLSLDRARLLHAALGNVIAAVDAANGDAS